MSASLTRLAVYGMPSSATPREQLETARIEICILVEQVKAELVHDDEHDKPGTSGSWRRRFVLRRGSAGGSTDCKRRSEAEAVDLPPEVIGAARALDHGLARLIGPLIRVAGALRGRLSREAAMSRAFPAQTASI